MLVINSIKPKDVPSSVFFSHGGLFRSHCCELWGFLYIYDLFLAFLGNVGSCCALYSLWISLSEGKDQFFSYCFQFFLFCVSAADRLLCCLRRWQRVVRLKMQWIPVTISFCLDNFSSSFQEAIREGHDLFSFVISAHCQIQQTHPKQLKEEFKRKLSNYKQVESIHCNRQGMLTIKTKHAKPVQEILKLGFILNTPVTPFIQTETTTSRFYYE